MHPYYIQLSRIFIPSAKTRRSFSLPLNYPKTCPPNMSLKERLTYLLDSPLLLRVFQCLLSDVNAWATSYRSNYTRYAQYTAEQILIWLYDLDVQKETYSLNTKFVNEVFANNYKMFVDEFVIAFPSLCEEVCQQCPVFIDNFWTAVQGYCIYQIKLQTIDEVFSSSLSIPEVKFDFDILPNLDFAEVQFIYAVRIREHALISLLLTAGDILKEAKPMQKPTFNGLVRKKLLINSGTCKGDFENLSLMLALVRTLIHLYFKFRFYIDMNLSSHDFEKGLIILQSQAAWCTARVPSLFALKSTKHEKFFQAVKNFEAACITEGNSLTNLMKTRDVLTRLLLNPNGSHYLKPSLLRLHLALTMETMDSKLLKNITDREKQYLQDYFGKAFLFTKPTIKMFVAFSTIFYSIQSTNSVHCVSKLLVEENTFTCLEQLLDKELIKQLKDYSNALEIPYNLEYVFKMYKYATDKRIDGLLKNSTDFSEIELRENDMQQLIQLVQERHWE